MQTDEHNNKKLKSGNALDPMRDKNEGKYRGGDGKAPVTTACPEVAEGETSYELSWRVKCDDQKTKFISSMIMAVGRTAERLMMRFRPIFALLIIMMLC